MNNATQEHTNTARNGRIFALIVASISLFSAVAPALAEPPANLLKLIAVRETESARARENYTYRQSFTLQELNDQGHVAGQYREVRDITFSPNMTRYEQVIEPAHNTLTRIKLTPEDFSDIRNVEPFLLTSDKVGFYEGTYRGEETIDGIICFVEFIRPRQILSGTRFFEGTIWVRQSDYTVIRSEGKAVPQVENRKEQNLFPHFTTLRKEVDGKYFFPVETYADDTLYFRDWPQRIKVIVRYMNYKKFGAESTVTFGPTPPPNTTPSANPPPNTPPPPVNPPSPWKPRP